MLYTRSFRLNFMWAKRVQKKGGFISLFSNKEISLPKLPKIDQSGISPKICLSNLFILEWVAVSFSTTWKWKVKVKLLSHVRLLVTPSTASYQAPPSMRFSRQEYWSGLPLPSPTSQLVTPFNEKSRFLTSFCNISCSTKLTRATFRFENSFHHSFPSMNSNICFPEAIWKRMIHDIWLIKSSW